MSRCQNTSATPYRWQILNAIPRSQCQNYPNCGNIEPRDREISGKCGIPSGEIVSPVEIVGNARYGTPVMLCIALEAHRHRGTYIKLCKS